MLDRARSHCRLAPLHIHGRHINVVWASLKAPPFLCPCCSTPHDALNYGMRTTRERTGRGSTRSHTVTAQHRRIRVRVCMSGAKK